MKGARLAPAPVRAHDRSMTMTTERWQGPLLGPDDPPPYEVVRPDAPSPFFLSCDHAGRRFPARLGTLGLTSADQLRHIAWDIGAEGVARRLSELLDATLVLQPYSRLVVDCNRTPEARDFIAVQSESTTIPGNLEVGPAEALARTLEIFRPYHAVTEAALDRRAAARRRTVLVAVHSCTDVYHGVWRPWHVGVLYDRDERFARLMLELLGAHGELTVGENQPYSLTHARDYSVPVHGEVRGLPHVELEIRQDLLATAGGQQEWAERLAVVLGEALARLG
jgi:predicted N-formylglutamate amidohydrolase